MFKKSIVPILILLIVILGISGCTTKTATNGTFGEKIISLDSIYLSNNTTVDRFNYNNTEYYTIQGYIINNNSIDAYHVKVNTTVYDANGNVVATNDSAYFDSTTINAKGISYFAVNFKDPNNLIVRYDVKVVDAKAMP